MLTLRPLSSVAGAEAIGLDLRAPISEELRRELLAAWRKHKLLLFRDQDLTVEDQRRVMSVFGEAMTRGYNTEDGLSYVSNVASELGHNPGGPLGFHLDYSFHEQPMRGLMLYAIETPPEGAGGDTLFSSTVLAYRSLPPALRERVDKLTIRHRSRLDPEHPHADHPLAFPHPATGETLLFLSSRHTDCILGLEPEESRTLMDELETYIERPEIVYRHAWRPGDLVVFDNIALLHARTDFDPKHRRHLRRLQIA